MEQILHDGLCLSDSPPERDINWSLSGINGAWRFTQKFWRVVYDCQIII
jgi:leucyl-tRNA synthetase